MIGLWIYLGVVMTLMEISRSLYKILSKLNDTGVIIMNYYKRITRRIQNEGMFKTMQYMLLVSLYCSREFIYNICLDLRYSHRLLKGNHKSLYKSQGANDVYHTRYSVMHIIFHFVPIKKSDVLVDVGCGKGRVINYWLSKKYHNKIYGLELDRNIALRTTKQFAKWKNVTIVPGDAISNIPNNGTILYFYNPFSEEVVRRFEKTLIERFKNRKVTIVYYNPKSIHVFQNQNWKIRYINFDRDLGLKRWGRINKYHELAIIKKRA
jgi:hypothetical protein